MICGAYIVSPNPSTKYHLVLRVAAFQFRVVLSTRSGGGKSSIVHRYVSLIGIIVERYFISCIQWRRILTFWIQNRVEYRSVARLKFSIFGPSMSTWCLRVCCQARERSASARTYGFGCMKQFIVTLWKHHVVILLSHQSTLLDLHCDESLVSHVLYRISRVRVGSRQRFRNWDFGKARVQEIISSYPQNPSLRHFLSTR